MTSNTSKLASKTSDKDTARILTYGQAINEALDQEMARDESVFVLGEDVGIYGGAYGVTRGLMEKYGEERICDTGISEGAIAGAAVGAAMTGMRPVAEIMYVDFMTLVMDQLCNQAAKLRYMFGGKIKVPMVIRTEGGSGCNVDRTVQENLCDRIVEYGKVWVEGNVHEIPISHNVQCNIRQHFGNIDGNVVDTRWITRKNNVK